MIIKLFQYFQLASLLLAMICFRGLVRYSLVAFIPLLIITNIVEMVGVSYAEDEANYNVYNLYMLLSTPLYIYLYGKMMKLRRNERYPFIGIGLLVMIFLLLNFFFWQGVKPFNTYSLILTEVVNIGFSCLILIRLAASDHVQSSLIQEPYFWINSAILLFALTMLVLLGLQQYILAHNILLGNKSLYYAIVPTVNIVLYSFFGIAFLLCQKHLLRTS